MVVSSQLIKRNYFLFQKPTEDFSPFNAVSVCSLSYKSKNQVICISVHNVLPLPQVTKSVKKKFLENIIWLVLFLMVCLVKWSSILCASKLILSNLSDFLNSSVPYTQC